VRVSDSEGVSQGGGPTRAGSTSVHDEQIAKPAMVPRARGPHARGLHALTLRTRDQCPSNLRDTTLSPTGGQAQQCRSHTRAGAPVCRGVVEKPPSVPHAPTHTQRPGSGAVLAPRARGHLDHLVDPVLLIDAGPTRARAPLPPSVLAGHDSRWPHARARTSHITFAEKFFGKQAPRAREPPPIPHRGARWTVGHRCHINGLSEAECA
jgi:hypothetical protein